MQVATVEREKERKQVSLISKQTLQTTAGNCVRKQVEDQKSCVCVCGCASSRHVLNSSAHTHTMQRKD